MCFYLECGMFSFSSLLLYVSAFLRLPPIHTVSHVVMISNQKIIFVAAVQLQFCYYYEPQCQHIWRQRFAKGSWPMVQNHCSEAPSFQQHWRQSVPVACLLFRLGHMESWTGDSLLCFGDSRPTVFENRETPATKLQHFCVWMASSFSKVHSLQPWQTRQMRGGAA